MTQPQALQLCPGQNAVPTIQCCSEKQAHSRQYVTAFTPMEMCSSYRCAVTQPQCAAARFRAKWSPQSSVLLCITGSQQAVCHCSHIYGDVLFIQMCSNPAPSTAALSRAKCSPHCSVLLRKTGSQQAVCHCSYTYGDVLFIQVCSDPAPSSTAGLSRAKCSPHCSLLLCKTGSQQAVCHCSCTYGDVLFIQVCSDPAKMRCSKVQGKLESPLFSPAMQHRLKIRQCVTADTPMELCSSYRCAVTQHQCTAALFRAKCSPHCSVLLCNTGSKAGSVSLHEHIWRCVRCAVTQPQALQLCPGQNAVPTVQCCSVKQAHSRQYVTAFTPMEMCSSYRCAVTQPQCAAARFRAKWSPQCSVLLCKTGSQQAVCHCSHIYGDVLFIQMCSNPAPSTSALSRAKCSPHCSVLLRKTG